MAGYRSEGPPPTIDGSPVTSYIGLVEKIARDNAVVPFYILWGRGGGGGGSVCNHYLSSCMDS